MKNKELQVTRMKGYFIQATKEILKSEGLKAISVRSIADRAGYSYATLYNYFKDVNDLVFLCVIDFQEECKEYVATNTAGSSKGIEKLKASVMSYLKYFIEYPGIFDLFYMAKGGDFGNKQQIIDIISHSLDNVCQADWEYCLKHKLLPEDQIEVLKMKLRYAVIGLLTLYLNRMSPKSYTAFISETNTLLNSTLSST